MRGWILAVPFVLSGVQGSHAVWPCTPIEDPCVVDRTVELIPYGDIDLGDRTLIITSQGSIKFGDALNVYAGNILMEPGARIEATREYAYVEIRLSGRFEMQSGPGATSVITIGSFESGGTLDIRVDGDVWLNGAVSASARRRWGEAEFVLVEAGGHLTVTGAGITARGGNDGYQGAAGPSMWLTGVAGLTIDAPVQVHGGECSGCDNFIETSGDFHLTERGSIDASAAGRVGDGGIITISAWDGSIRLDGPITARGRGSIHLETEGTGGDVSLFAYRDVVVNAPIDVRSPDRYGTGGSVEVSTEGHFEQRAPILARGGTSGGSVDVNAGRVTMTDTDARSTDFGGYVIVDANEVDLRGRIRADATHRQFSAGDEISIRARCALQTGARSLTSASGRAPFNGGEVRFTSPMMTLAGRIRAGHAINLTTAGTSPTIAAGASIRPAPTVTTTVLPPCPSP